MNFVASTILLNLVSSDLNDLEKIELSSFWIFVSIMEKFKLKDYYLEMSKICELLQILDIMVKTHYPNLYNYITFEDFSITVYFHNLFWTLSTHVIPLEYSSRMIDIFLFFNLKIFIKLFYLILVKNEKQILETKKSNLMDKIRNQIIPDTFKNSEEI